MTVEETVLKGQRIIQIAEENDWDEYETAVVDQFGEYLRGVATLEEVNRAFDEWLETVTE